MNANFQPSKVCLQHSKVHRMFPTVQLCLLLSLLVLMRETYKLQHVYKVRDFYIKTIRYSCLLGDNHKFIANVRNMDHKSPKYIILLHSNVTFNIRILQHSKVRSNVEHSFMHYGTQIKMNI